MNLTRIELCCLRVADGIATPKDFERLKQVGIDPDQWRDISSVLRKHLHSDASIDISTQVMREIESAVVGLPSLKDILIDSEPPLMADNIMERIFEDEIDFPLPMSVLRDTEPPALTDLIMQSVLKENQEELDELASEDLLDSVFPMQDTSMDFEDEVGKEDADEDESIEFFPEISSVVDEDPLENDVGDVGEQAAEKFDSILQEELAKVLQEALSEEGRVFDDAEIVSLDQSVIELAGKRSFEAELERIDVNDLDDPHFEDDSDEEVLTLTSPYVITEAVLEEQAIRFPFDLAQVFIDEDSDVELNIWSAISSKIIAPPLRLVRETNDDSTISEERSEENLIESNQAVEFISTKTIDVDSTISRVSLWTLGGLISAAAVWLMFVLPSQSVLESKEDRVVEAFEVAEVNSLEVQELEVAKDMEVQIFQASEDAPTIIFIDSYPSGGE